MILAAVGSVKILAIVGVIVSNPESMICVAVRFASAFANAMIAFVFMDAWVIIKSSTASASACRLLTAGVRFLLKLVDVSGVYAATRSTVEGSLPPSVCEKREMDLIS